MSLWYHSLARNKKSVTLDLKSERGRELAFDLLTKADVVIENFRPGAMESWGLGPDQVKETNPGIIYARISGYGTERSLLRKTWLCLGYRRLWRLQIHQWRARQGTGAPQHLAWRYRGCDSRCIGRGICHYRAHQKWQGPGGRCALYESIFNLLEGIVPEFDGAGVVEPSGTTITGIVPTNTYLCSDGKHVVIGGNGDSIFKRLMAEAGREDMANDPELEHNQGRVIHEQKIDAALAKWCSEHSSADIISKLEAREFRWGPSTAWRT